MYWQRAMYFPLVDHLVQELNDKLLSQENRFLGQYLVPAKLNAFNQSAARQSLIFIDIATTVTLNRS